VNESLPALLAPYALAELAEWEILWAGYCDSGLGGDRGGGFGGPAPLAADADDAARGTGEPPHPLTDLTWVGELADFGQSDDAATSLSGPSAAAASTASFPSSRADSELVPRLVSLQVVPRVAALLNSHAYDPFSARQTRALAGCVAELLDFGLDPHQGGVPLLLAAPLAALHRAAAQLAVPVAASPESFLAAANRASSRPVDEALADLATDAGLALMVAQLWRGAKLARNACQWASLVAPSPLATFVVRDLLAAKLAPALVQLASPAPHGWNRAGASLTLARHLARSLPDAGNHAAAWGPALRAAASQLAPLVAALEAQAPGDPHVALLRSRFALQ
jgi:hypothetical protein